MSAKPKTADKHDIQLECPECGEEVRLNIAALGLGRRARCGHCGVESYLNHYRDPEDGPLQWRLESTLPEADPGRA